jgi:hypothetical protein
MDNLYLNRYATRSLGLDIEPPADLRMVVAVPAFKEPKLLETLKSLASCTLPSHSVIVLVVINQPAGCDPSDALMNQGAYDEATEWASANNSQKLAFHIVWVKDMPVKHAGVGLARKIAMDEAVRLFEKLRSKRPAIHEEGVIVCFDADCLCDRNYLQEIERVYGKDKKCPAAVVYYEHPLEGPLDPEIYINITRYELFLRYHVNALRFTGYPYAYQTVGSCMTVRSAVYQKQGGMSKKQAGEDFYFLQKLFPLKGFREINGTRVIPSPRISDRVPFGTGKAIADLAASKGSFMAYHPNCYEDIRKFLVRITELFHYPCNLEEVLDSVPESIRIFLINNRFGPDLHKLRASSPSLATFVNKMFHWLNGFRMLKFIHFARDNYYQSIEVEKAAIWLLKARYGRELPGADAEKLLMEFRKTDRHYSDTSSGTL